MENTLENKKKFFALYWGQPILNLNGSDSFIYELLEILFLNNGAVGFETIGQFKSIEDISDEDLMGIAIICGWKEYDAFNCRHILLQKGKEIMQDYADDENRDYGQELTDHLRLNGYLIPFHDLTTEQIIEYGWAKIKQNEQ